jgi:hypothetical protein
MVSSALDAARLMTSVVWPHRSRLSSNCMATTSIILADISQVRHVHDRSCVHLVRSASAGARWAPWKGGVREERTIDLTPRSLFELPSVLFIDSRHRAPPSVPANAPAPPRYIAGAGGPRSRLIRRRISANKARGTATSAS